VLNEQFIYQHWLDPQLRGGVVTAGALSPVVAAVSAADPKALTVRPPSLEEIFLDHYNGDRDDAPSAAGERVAGGE